MLIYLFLLIVAIALVATGSAMIFRWWLRREHALEPFLKKHTNWLEEKQHAEAYKREFKEPEPVRPEDIPGARGLVVFAGLIALGFVVFFGAQGIKQINPGEIAALTRFGEVQEGRSLPPGLHFVTPLVESTTTFDTRIQPYNFEDVQAATKDLQPVALRGLINYHLDPTKVEFILQNIGGPGEYAEKVFLRPANTALKEVTPLFNALEIVSKREEIGQLTLTRLSERMAPLGIIVDRVSVENVSLNPDFLASVEAKQKAEQDRDRAAFEAEREVRLAEGDRDAQVTRARGDRDAAILRAEGEAQANDLINASLTDDLLTFRAIEKLNPRVQAMLIPQGQGFIIDLGNLQQEEETQP